MGKLRRIWEIIWNQNVPYEELISEQAEAISAKDLLRFMEKQTESNATLVQAVLQANVSQSKVLENYIDWFKPRDVRSTTLDEREQAKEASTKVREDEWEPAMISEILGGGLPPDPSEW